MPYNSTHLGATIDQAVSKVQASEKLINVSADTTIAASHLSKTIVLTSAADAVFTIPNDTTLNLDADANVSFEVFQKGNGVATFVGGAGVTVNMWLGYPAPSQYVTQTVHRVGVNEWAVK